MNSSFLSGFDAMQISLTLFLLMLLVYFIAKMMTGLRPFQSFADENINPIEGSLLGLLALLLAFTFSMSASRYEARRNVMVSEANDIGTVILRCDLYPDSTARKLKMYLKDYVESRINYFQAGESKSKENTAIEATERIGKQIWAEVALASKTKDNLVASNQMIPALNAMLDIVTNRSAEKNATVPDSILWLMFLLCIICSFIVGFHPSKSKNRFVISIVFSLMVSACIHLIIDLDRPRKGLINMKDTQLYIIDLRKMF
jgi:hypothetical protein